MLWYRCCCAVATIQLNTSGRLGGRKCGGTEAFLRRSGVNGVWRDAARRLLGPDLQILVVDQILDDQILRLDEGCILAPSSAATEI